MKDQQTFGTRLELVEQGLGDMRREVHSLSRSFADFAGRIEGFMAKQEASRPPELREYLGLATQILTIGVIIVGGLIYLFRSEGYAHAERLALIEQRLEIMTRETSGVDKRIALIEQLLEMHRRRAGS